MTYKLNDVINAIIYDNYVYQINQWIPKKLIEIPNNRKLNILLYLTQISFLSIKNKSVFKEKIIVSSKQLIPKIKNYERKNININFEEIKKWYFKLNKKDKKIINFVNKTYWEYSLPTLINLIKNHKPIKETILRDSKIIAKKRLKKYYKNIIKNDFISFKNINA